MNNNTCMRTKLSNNNAIRILNNFGSIPLKHYFPAIALAFFSSSCCKFQIDQVCYRQGNAGPTGELGTVGYRRATFSGTKGFEALGFPTIPSEIPLTISQMKILDTSTGKVAVKASATSDSIKEIVDGGGSFSTSLDSSSSLLARTISFQNAYQLRQALNQPENRQLREDLFRKGSNARVITRIVRAYNHSNVNSSTVTGSLNASLASSGTVAGPQASFEVNSTRKTEREVAEGNIVAYEWSKIVWDKTDSLKIDDLKLDSTFWD